MKLVKILAAVLGLLPAVVVAAPVGPVGPCAQAKVDAILKGIMDPSACCSYGNCKRDVVVSVG
ncbi:hypothetical protein E4U41_003829 [Claviceps citrina]|nr:hypothetical protein E4U41_003829 [Claviceps citrina]